MQLQVGSLHMLSCCNHSPRYSVYVMTHLSGTWIFQVIFLYIVSTRDCVHLTLDCAQLILTIWNTVQRLTRYPLLLKQVDQLPTTTLDDYSQC